ncbi:Dihydrolipoyl dehydrogenase [Seminavis robusta]|uniref:Dihydrolipoyl dehydrogenase n=1 Tax=Seminavis robusta TaxID=568900 RepID=A0A9N8HD40_9STRA|nr:Dihydrolipoyl dehydrogenase [Seminavis robusta]|eukprot:Sro344_g122210.1 Dihydrolipoyl dehydrogenase (525) ;mRNA; r:36749-38323
MATSPQQWTADDPQDAAQARSKLNVWPLDEHNAVLLNQVHPKEFQDATPHEEYDLIAIGSGAGGLVSSKQSARRGAKSAMISEHLAGGDCLNVGCVPSKALLRSAKAVAAVRDAAQFGVVIGGDISVDFAAVMKRVRYCRAKIAPADGHVGTEAAGTHVYQGRGVLTGANTVEVNGKTLKFKKCVIATGGRPTIPQNVPGLEEAPYITNEQLFNLEQLPPRMVVLGAGVIALEMAQCFALLGSNVTVINRSSRLFESKQGDAEAAAIIQKALESHGVTFLSNAKITKVTTIDAGCSESNKLPVMQVTVNDKQDLGCDCLLVAAGRSANVENMGLENAYVEYDLGKGIVVNDFGQSNTNPSIWGVGDCVADVPRLTHMSGEMAKMVVQNALAGDDWKLSSLVVPAVAYTEPEYATVGVVSQDAAAKQGLEVDVYRAGLEHNDRAICEGNNVGFCKILCKKGTDEIVGATIVAERAGEMINEVSLAIKNNIGLYAIGRNIHSYPTTGEAVMGCGVQYINSKLPRFD